MLWSRIDETVLPDGDETARGPHTLVPFIYLSGQYTKLIKGRLIYRLERAFENSSEGRMYGKQ
jgi:hypothetical protein